MKVVVVVVQHSWGPSLQVSYQRCTLWTCVLDVLRQNSHSHSQKLVFPSLSPQQCKPCQLTLWFQQSLFSSPCPEQWTASTLVETTPS
jgi:hypothetical protein